MVHSEKLNLHDAPITFLKFNPFGNYVLSFASGVPELWDPLTFESPSRFELLSETDLLMLCESYVVGVEFSEFFVAVMTSDMKVWIFSQSKLNLVKLYD